LSFLKGSLNPDPESSHQSDQTDLHNKRGIVLLGWNREITRLTANMAATSVSSPRALALTSSTDHFLDQLVAIKDAVERLGGGSLADGMTLITQSRSSFLFSFFLCPSSASRGLGPQINRGADLFFSLCPLLKLEIGIALMH
jgi:hypothetical protein